MDGGLFTEATSLALSDAALLALAAALPTLFVLYLRYHLQERSLQPDLALGKLEVIELRRAVLLYEQTCRRREEICRQRKSPGSGLLAWYRARAEFRKSFGAELEELNCYARDLRAIILRLRRRPLQRFKYWIHIHSSRSALGRSLCCYCVVLAALAVIAYDPEPLRWVAGIADTDIAVPWPALEGRLLLANALAVALVCAVMPPLYLTRRVQLHKHNEFQLRNFRTFAAADPGQWVDDAQGGDAQDSDPQGSEEPAEEATADGPPVVPEMPAGSSWFDVLGVPSSATIDDVRQAYKALVKQNHPDRVFGMSPVFRTLAETETKKINVAYAQALACLRQDGLQPQEMAGAA
jgi:DnaJ-like protein